MITSFLSAVCITLTCVLTDDPESRLSQGIFARGGACLHIDFKDYLCAELIMDISAPRDTPRGALTPSAECEMRSTEQLNLLWVSV